MALYIDYEFYTALYGEITETDFNRLGWEACRVLDTATTGADGYKKLKHAFPVDEDDAESVKRCAAKLVHALRQLEAAEGKGYTETENGLKGCVIASVSSGSESISYATNATVIEHAAADPDMRNRLLRDTVSRYLSGAADSNGVGLLYMGVYPNV